MKPTRSLLHAWLWKMPALDVARALHISPSTVRRHCKRLNIPLPPRGYWRCIETGHPASKTPLPEPDREGLLNLEVDEEQVQAAFEAATQRLQMKAGTSESTAARAGDLELSGSGGSLAIQTPGRTTANVERLEASAPVPTGFESAGASVASSFMAPELPTLLGMVELHLKLRAADALLDELQAIARASTPATGAVMALWVERSREALAKADVVACLTRECGEIAEGKGRPEWWASMLRERNAGRSF